MSANFSRRSYSISVFDIREAPIIDFMKLFTSLDVYPRESRLFSTVLDLVNRSGLATRFKDHLDTNLTMVTMNRPPGTWTQRPAQTIPERPRIDMMNTVQNMMDVTDRFLMTAMMTLWDLDLEYPDASLRCEIHVTDLTRMRLFTHLSNDLDIQNLWPPPTPDHLAPTRLPGHFVEYSKKSQSFYAGCFRAVARETLSEADLTLMRQRLHPASSDGIIYDRLTTSLKKKAIRWPEDRNGILGMILPSLEDTYRPSIAAKRLEYSSRLLVFEMFRDQSGQSTAWKVWKLAAQVDGKIIARHLKATSNNVFPQQEYAQTRNEFRRHAGGSQNADLQPSSQPAGGRLGDPPPILGHTHRSHAESSSHSRLGPSNSEWGEPTPHRFVSTPADGAFSLDGMPQWSVPSNAPRGGSAFSEPSHGASSKVLIPFVALSQTFYIRCVETLAEELRARWYRDKPGSSGRRHHGHASHEKKRLLFGDCAPTYMTEYLTADAVNWPDEPGHDHGLVFDDLQRPSETSIAAIRLERAAHLTLKRFAESHSESKRLKAVTQAGLIFVADGTTLTPLLMRDQELHKLLPRGPRN